MNDEKPSQQCITYASASETDDNKLAQLELHDLMLRSK